MREESYYVKKINIYNSIKKIMTFILLWNVNFFRKLILSL